MSSSETEYVTTKVEFFEGFCVCGSCVSGLRGVDRRGAFRTGHVPRMHRIAALLAYTRRGSA